MFQKKGNHENNQPFSVTVAAPHEVCVVRLLFTE